MDITISIPPEREARLIERAAALGKDPRAFLTDAALRAIDDPTLEEISGPVQEDFANSGMTDDELGEFLESVKHKARAERRATGS